MPAALVFVKHFGYEPGWPVLAPDLVSAEKLILDWEALHEQRGTSSSWELVEFKESLFEQASRLVNEEPVKGPEDGQ